MSVLRPSEVVFLIREVERYLAAVALYRELGCEPKWRTEWLAA